MEAQFDTFVCIGAKMIPIGTNIFDINYSRVIILSEQH